MKQMRKSNMELLRIVGIFLIVIFHCAYKADFTFNANYNTNKLVIKTFWLFGELGVNLFMLISGYFMINSKFKIKKLILLIAEVLFYHILTIPFAIYMGFYKISKIKDILLIFFPITLKFYWFITIYILIYILSPYLNTLAKSITRSMYKKLLLILLFLYSFIPTFFGSVYNSTEELLYYNRLIWLIIVYFIGAYIKLYSMSIIKNIKKSIQLSILSFLTLIISILVIEKYHNFFNFIGIKEVAYLWTPNNIPMILLSIGVFGMFTHLNISDNKFINKLASTVLGIYLLHDGVLCRWLWNTVFKLPRYQNSALLYIYILASGFIVLVIGAMIDLIRQLIEKYTLKKIIESESANNLYIKIKSKINKLLEIGD